MKTKTDALLQYFDEKIAACKEKEALCLSDSREDEAKFEKIRANIYDIFRTMVNASVKISNGSEEKARAFYFGKLEQIPENWKKAYALAEKHGDSEAMHIESIKLETKEIIRRDSEMIWED